MTLAARPCPACGLLGTFARALGAADPGDLVICLACGEISVYTVHDTVRVFTSADLPHYDLEMLAQATRQVRELRTAYARRN